MKKPDYGIDAPGLASGFLAGALGAVGLAWPLWQFGEGRSWSVVACAGLLSVGIYLSGMGCLMVVWSKRIKLQTRETILDHIPWRGDERVLDVGCGRGLLMVGAAKRLENGRVTGIDIWQAKDQSANGPQGALENALLEGVADRVEIETGDVRALPFADASFDVVMSHWVVHNLVTAADRTLALGEMVRVLRFGGKLILADIEYRDAYVVALKALGLVECRIEVNPLLDRVLGAVSFGSFRPATIFAQKDKAAQSA